MTAITPLGQKIVQCYSQSPVEKILISNSLIIPSLLYDTTNISKGTSDLVYSYFSFSSLEIQEL